MTRTAWIALALVAASAGGVALVRQRAEPARLTPLALVTSLPLLFAETFSLNAPKVAAIARIEQRHVIAPIATADAVSLAGHKLLLMAHPRAQPADVLVELDAWVRRGGRAVLLADPVLKWESSRMLGDRLRPPPDFADTGLLGHWGLRLAVDEAGEGRLAATGTQCVVRERGLVARCRIGRGSASVIADADFMMAHGADAAARLDLLMDELSRAESR